jgi:hypothetical protein
MHLSIGVRAVFHSPSRSPAMALLLALERDTHLEIPFVLSESKVYIDTAGGQFVFDDRDVEWTLSRGIGQRGFYVQPETRWRDRLRGMR